MFNTVNQHCLDSIVTLSKNRPVSADDDIFDDRGNKLWARGQHISSGLQEKLVRRKLARPLESTLTVEGALTFADVIDDCRKLAAKQSLLERIEAKASAFSLIDDLRNIAIPGPLRLLLTAVREQHHNSYRHMLACMVISAGIAEQAKLDDHDVKVLMLSALLHDLGEMYINPDYVRSSRQLNCMEWKHVASHPRIGQLLVQELTSLPPAVGLCILQHHRRLDGSGYPHFDGHLSPHHLAALLAIADTAAGICARTKSGAVSRIALALKVVPEEYDRKYVSALLVALGDETESIECDEPDCGCHDKAVEIAHRIAAAIRVAEASQQQGTTPFSRELAGNIRGILSNLEKSMRSAGVLEANRLDSLDQDPALLNEIRVAVAELEWRLRDLARNTFVRAEIKGAQELRELTGLILALDAEALGHPVGEQAPPQA